MPDLCAIRHRASSLSTQDKQSTICNPCSYEPVLSAQHLKMLVFIHPPTLQFRQSEEACFFPLNPEVSHSPFTDPRLQPYFSLRQEGSIKDLPKIPIFFCLHFMRKKWTGETDSISFAIWLSISSYFTNSSGGLSPSRVHYSNSSCLVFGFSHISHFYSLFSPFSFSNISTYFTGPTQLIVYHSHLTKDNFCLNMLTQNISNHWSGEMTQWINCLLWGHKDLSSDPGTHLKKKQASCGRMHL